MPHRKSRVTRRRVIGTLGVVGAAAAVTPLASAAISGSSGSTGSTPQTGERVTSIPQTRAQSASGEAAHTVKAGFSIHYVGVSWTGSKRGASIRLHQENGTPGEWQSLTAGCAGGPDDAAIDAATNAAALFAAGGAPGYDVRLPDGAADIRSAAIDTLHGATHDVTLPATTPVMFGGIEYLSRAAWGADESKRFKNGAENSPRKFYPLQTTTVHHTDTPNADPDPAATVRAIYQYHAVTLDWGDIGYHFLIDEDGRVYEGRYTGSGIPAFDTKGDVVTAFHTAGFNSGNLGVALIGTLADQQPTERARRSLTLLLAAVTRTHNLDPEAQITFVNPVNGVTKAARTINGHRDWLATDCPGGTMYGTLPALRTDDAHLGGTGY